MMLVLGCMVMQSQAQKSLPPASHAPLPPGMFDRPSMPPPSAIPPSRGEQVAQKVKEIPEQIKDLPYRALRTAVGYAAGKSEKSDPEQSGRRSSLGQKISERVDDLKDIPTRLKGAAIRATGRGDYERHGDEVAKAKEGASQTEANVKWKKTTMTEEDAKKLDAGLKRDRDSKDVAKASPERALIATALNVKDEAQARIDVSKARLADAEKIVDAQKQYLEAKKELERAKKDKMDVEAAQKDGGAHGDFLKILTNDLKKAEDNVQKKQGLLNEQLDGRSIKTIQAEVAAAKKQIKAEEDQIKQADKVITAASDKAKINNTIPMLEERIAENRELLKTGTAEEKSLAAQRISNNKKLIEESKKDLKEAEKILATEKLPTGKKAESSGISGKKKVALGAAVVGAAGLVGAASIVGAVGAIEGVAPVSEEGGEAASESSQSNDSVSAASDSFQASTVSDN